jgi:outer membrane lipoprotein-sorting protein
MKVGSMRVMCGAMGTAAVWLLSVALVGGQAPAGPPTAAQNQMAAERVFKNVTALRGIPVDEFMGTMGVFSAALGISCEDCHTGGSNNWVRYAEDVSPRKTRAREMVAMMAGINKQYFGGRQVVTCFSCHRGSLRPKVTPSLDLLYSAPPLDELDVLVPPAEPGGPTAVQILDKYLQAVGGARATELKSYTAKGTYSGYGPEGTPRPFELYAQAPNRKSIRVVDPDAGDNITTFSGKESWHSAPFRPIPVLELHTAELDAARADAELMFPANIKTMLTAMRTSNDFLNDRTVLVVQGNKGNAIVTLYFDEETGLLTRFVRSTPSPVGRLPVRIDYSDYRDVNGVKLPFKWTQTWLDGRSNFEVDSYQTNAAVDAARFNRPAPPTPYAAANSR